MKEEYKYGRRDGNMEGGMEVGIEAWREGLKEEKIEARRERYKNGGMFELRMMEEWSKWRHGG